MKNHLLSRLAASTAQKQDVVISCKNSYEQIEPKSTPEALLGAFLKAELALAVMDIFPCYKPSPRKKNP